MSSIKVHLEPKHRKLMRGQVCQLSPAHLSGGAGSPVELKLSAAKVRAIQKAMRLGKGYRLRMGQDEIEGSGLKEVFGQVKEGAKKVAKGAKRGFELYKEHIKPVVGPSIRKGLKTATKAGLAALAVSQPELIPAIALLESQSDKLVDLVGDKTGAYGLKKGRGRPKGTKKGARTCMCGGAIPSDVGPMHYAPPSYDTYSSVIPTQHSANWPILPQTAPGLWQFIPQGGSFMAGSFRAQGC